jgi:phosphoglycolate phosphatase
VLFDLDGVLADSYEVWVAVLQDCRMRRGLEQLSPERIRACWGQGLAADCETLFPGAEPARLAAEYERGFHRHVGRVREVPGASALVAQLRSAGTALAVVSNSPVAVVAAVLDALALRSSFPVLCGGDEVAEGKPHPELVHVALDRLGVDGAEAVMIGDTPLDVRAARAAGVFSVGYRVDADLTVRELAELGPFFRGRATRRAQAD